MIIEESMHTISKINDIIGKRTVEQFSVARYSVLITSYDGSKEKWYSVSVDDKNNYYLPYICVRQDSRSGKLLGFEVQTTSYGSLSLDETAKFIDDMTEGYQVAKYLTEKYLGENK